MHSKQRHVIFSGGAIGGWALDDITPDDRLIGADRGAFFLINNGLIPDISIGDFDSVTPEQFEQIERASRLTVRCDSVDKNETDTELAVNWALAQQARFIRIIGGVGTRVDHTLANIHLLKKILEYGAQGQILDSCNLIQLTADQLTIERGRFTHVSLLPLTSEVKGITLSGFKYPLRQACLQIGQSLGVSNELVGQSGTIILEDGLLLVIQSTG